MCVYRSRHGTLPVTDGEQLFDIIYNFPVYGFKGREDYGLSSQNPDLQYSDMYKDHPNLDARSAFVTCPTRPDGTKRTLPKKAGERDVLVFTGIYFHANECVFPKGRTTKNPVGFYIMLWEDGEVTKVDHDAVRYTYPQRAIMPECFPGQGGIPQTTYTFEERKRHILPLNKDGSNPNVVESEESKQIIAEAIKGISEEVAQLRKYRYGASGKKDFA